MKIHLNVNRFVSGCIGGGSSSSTTEVTNTLSGSAQQGGSDSAAAQTGSIAIGGGSKYQEQGSIDLSNSSGSGIGGEVGSVGSGSTINIVPPAALDALQNLSNQFASTVQNIAAGSVAGEEALAGAQQTVGAGSISYKKLGLILAGITAVFGLFALLRRKKT